MKVAAFSVASVDFYPQQNTFFPGGNSLNQLLRFTQLGHPSAFIGAVGNDQYGNKLIGLMKAKKIDTSHTYQLSGKTASNNLIVYDNGERFEKEGAWDDGVYGKFRLGEKDWDFIRKFEIWVTHANGPDYLNALQKKTPKNFISVDFLHSKDYDLLNKSVDFIDIAFFGGDADMINNIEKITRQIDCIIVLTLGAEGSIAFSGSKVYTQQALPIDKVVDTTGCGDAFQAGFVSNYVKTKDIKLALLEGSRLGKEAALVLGGAQWHT